MTSFSDRPPQSRLFDTPRLGRLLLLLSIGAIALITLGPTSSAHSAALTPLSCLVCGDFGAVDVVLNTMLFLPLGLALGLLRVSWRRAAVVAMLAGLGIEILQFTLIPGRDASLSDVITNTTGAALGALLTFHWRRLMMPELRAARALFAALLIGWVSARLSTAWLLRPSFPDTRWYGQVAPADVYPFDFLGTVVRGTLGAVPARSEAMPELNDVFRTPAVTVTALVTGAKPTGGLASVLSVLDEHQSEVFVLGQESDAARLRFRLRTADLRFRTPSLRLDGALAHSAGEQIELVGRLRAGELSLSSSSGSRAAAATLSLGPGLAWALLLPFDVGLAPAGAAAGTAACTAVVLLVIGFYAGRAKPDRPAIAIATSVGAAVVGLWFPVLLFPEATVAATEAIAATGGAVLGAALGVARTAASAQLR